MFFSLYHFFTIINNMNKKEVTEFYQPISINRINYIKQNDSNDIFIGGKENSSIQVFNSNGNFLYGVSIPTNGGDYDFGFINNELHIITRRSNLHIIMNETILINIEEINYDKYESLLSILAQNKESQKYKYNGINKISILQSDGTYQEVKLNIPIFPLSIYVYFIFLGISILGLIINNSLIEKLQNDYPEQSQRTEEVIKFFTKKKL